MNAFCRTNASSYIDDFDKRERENCSCEITHLSISGHYPLGHASSEKRENNLDHTRSTVYSPNGLSSVFFSRRFFKNRLVCIV